MPEPVHDTAPRLWPKGNRYEDFEVGQQLEHHWGRTLSEADNTIFCTSTLCWLPLHLNADYAREQGHEGVLLHPLLVFCTVLGLSVQDLSESGGAFLGVDDLRFLEPVRPGVTVYGRSTVLAMRESASRPRQGIVTWRTEGVDGEGRVLIDFKRSNLILRRDV